jgi:gliding motility-associated-like protein
MNHGFQLLQTLYASSFGKYMKFKHRFDRAIQSGKFKKLSKRKQSSLINRLRKLFERLRSLKTQLRLAGTGVALSLAATLSNPVSGQGLGPFERNDAANPLPPPFVISHPRVAMVDIDNDGDIDSFVGNSGGDILFFRNDSPTSTVRRFVEVTGADNPLDGVNKGYQAAPTLADVDGDGDFDMLLGISYGDTFFFRNTGTPTNPVFIEQTGANNPFDGITGTRSVKYGTTSIAIPVFVDIDEDLDVDLFVGSSFSSDYYGVNQAVQYFENQGTNFVPVSHPLLSSLTYLRDASLTFADLDADGDLDAAVGQYYSGYGIRTFRNDGASFTELTGGSDPTNGFYVRQGSPAFADVDGDGDLDFVVGHTNVNRTSIYYAENTGGFTLERNDGLNLSPFGGVDVGNDAAPTFTDIDGDGDLDAIIGSKYSGQGLTVFLNNEGLFIEDSENPMSDIDGNNIVPSFVDIDDDGDVDLFYGGRSISFFRNIGTSTNPVFGDDAEPNLFPSLYSGNSYDLSISFIDMDGDGDFDALIGNDDYGNRGVSYFENTGSATAPEFTTADIPAPFDDENIFEYNPNVVAVDLDNDGDLDLAITETYYNGWYGDSNAGRTRFFENIGSEFIEMDNPLLIELTPQSITAFADIDGDGDLDAFVGNGYSFDAYQDGKVFYYENTNPAPVTSVTQNSVSVAYNTPVRLDPDLSISDDDNDDIILATVVISNFSEGNELLDFTPSAGVTGEFEDGVLTIRGKATLEEYENILQTVTYEATNALTSSRQASGRLGVPPGKTVTFSVRDTDFTETVISVVSVITLDITGEPGGIVIYNAVSPGVTPGENDYMRIDGLSSDNQVTIFNRWGDEVFKTSGYDNNSKRFEGKNDNGKELPSGTYFYTIEVSGKTITGYLSLKR